jgi:hypothetical protein
LPFAFAFAFAFAVAFSFAFAVAFSFAFAARYSEASASRLYQPQSGHHSAEGGSEGAAVTTEYCSCFCRCLIIQTMSSPTPQ